METPLWILIVCISSFVVDSFEVPEECLVSPEWEAPWTGSNITITSWMSIKKESAKMASPLLTLRFENGTSPSTEYNLLELWRSNASWTRWEDDFETVTWVTYQEELSEGWVDLHLSVSDSGMVLSYLEGTRLLSMNEPLEYGKVTLIGTHVAVDCHRSYAVWSLEEYGGKAVLPLQKENHQRILSTENSTEYAWHFALFSKNFTKPSLSFLSVAYTLQLGWNGTLLLSSSEETLDDDLDPLPPFSPHLLSVFCAMQNTDGFCDVWNDQEQETIWSLEMDSIPEELVVTTSSGDQLYVFIRRPTVTETRLLSERRRGVANKGGMSVDRILSLVIIGLVLISIVTLVVVSSIQHDRIVGKGEKRLSFTNILYPDGGDEGEVEPFLNNHWETPRPLPTGSIIMEEESLWEAVQSGDIDGVKSLLEQGYRPDEVEVSRFSTPLLDAHMLGKKEVVKVFSDWKGEKYITAPDDLVKSVLYEMERSMKEIFLAAECGMYEHEQGVEVLLKTYCLPATIIDNHGRSLLHCMASVTAMDGIPVWQPKDIKKFFASHEVYPNARDYYGRTALHELSQHPQEVETDVLWDGKEWRLPDAWLFMARLLVSFGCDPRIANHEGRRPDQLAFDAGNLELAKFLEQKCSELGNISPEDKIELFESLVTAVIQGETSKVRQLLLLHVPLLPVGAKVDPLVEAIRCCHRDIVFILLSAGAPLCNRSIGEVTPLEAAHNTLGLPACFPAILRKAFNERMEDEIARASQVDEDTKNLRQCMTAYNLQVMDAGSKARWIFPAREGIDKCKEAKNLLVQSSALGLSLTCQLLGLENVYIHSLPSETNAFLKAIEYRHVDTQLVLYRELAMSPFTFETPENLYWDLLEVFWVHEVKAFEELCKNEKKKDEKLRLEKDLSNLKKLRNESMWDSEASDDDLDGILFHLAKYGLITLLHVILNQFEKLDIDKVVDHRCEYTLMHVASAYGNIGVLEYLLYHGAALDVLSLGGYTPAHIAAITGHSKCFEFIMDHMKIAEIDFNAKCYFGLTATELMEKYEELCSVDNLPPLPHESALLIKNEKDEQTKVYEMLSKRGAILNITGRDSLLLKAKTKLFKKHEMEDIDKLIMGEVETFGSMISESGYKGKMVQVGSFHDGYEVLGTSQIDFIYEVNDMGDGEDLSFEDIKEEERITIGIESNVENSIYLGDAFLSAFLKRIEDLLVKFKPSSPFVSLVPPYVSCTSNGVCLYWIIKVKEHVKLLRTLIMPVLPATCPADDVRDTLPSDICKYFETNSDMQLHLINDHGEWIYFAGASEGEVFKNLSKAQKTVWTTCLFLTRLLQSTWWSPSFQSRNHAKQKHTLSLGCQLLPDRGLRSLFLEELVESQEWTKKDLFNRVISVFHHACKRDMMEKWVPREYINSFVTPHHFCCRIRESMYGLLQYLEEVALVREKELRFAEP